VYEHVSCDATIFYIAKYVQKGYKPASI